MKRSIMWAAVSGCAFRRAAGVLLVSSALVCGTAPAAKAGGSVWIADSSNLQVAEILPNKLKHSGQPAEAVNESAAITDDPWGVCFDKKKNLWVTDDSEQVLEFTSAQLKKLNANSNSPSPAVTISSSSFSNIIGCNFDSAGNLWLVDEGNQSVDEISTTQLQAGGPINPPHRIITDSEFDYPDFLAFDKSGNLWVSDENGSSLLAFSPSQQASGGTQTAFVKISGGSLDEPGELAFDNHGNLWVTNYGDNTVVMFAKKDLGASGSPASAVTLSGAAFVGPWGLAFQNGNSGPLWILNYNDGTLNEFLPSQIMSSGSPTPKVSLSNTSSSAYQITSGPVDGKAGDTN
jgi:sugar lactone lactonase YvrE